MKRIPFLSLLILVLGIVALPAQDPPPPAAPPYFRVRYEASTQPGELVFSVSYTVWIPPGVKTLRGVIVHQHGCGEGACQAGRTAAFDLHWQALARRHECALLGPSYEQPEKANCGLWCDPRHGSGKKFLQALGELAEQSRHPELATVPWALWGHSGGANWAGTMLVLHPERTVAVWLRSGSPRLVSADGKTPPLEIPAAVWAVPVLCNLGIKEKTDRFAKLWESTFAFFTDFRAQGGLIGVAVDPNSSHDCGNSRYLAIPWFDACLAARLPEKAGDAILQPMPTGGEWLAPLPGDAAQPAAQFTGDVKSAVWLPNERIARAWAEYVKDGNVSDATPPPAPTNVKLAGGELTWEAEADWESGLASFIIERDGAEVGRVPAKSSGSIGRPVFQITSYSDTPALPLAEMRLADPAANPGGKTAWRVFAVNSTGLKSAPGNAALPAGREAAARNDARAVELHDFNVRDFGAKGDGATFDTAAIQAAIDACTAAKGGRVMLRGGIFLTRTIQLKSNVTLHLEAGAVLQGTKNLEDYAEIKPAYVSYTYSHRALIYAEGAENVSILGKGAIDLAGRDFPPQPMPAEAKKKGLMEWGGSPFGLRLVQCRGLTLRDVTIRNCPMAALRVEGCEQVVLEGLRIDNRVRISCDGIEIVSCREVVMSNCRVSSWDDAICLKSASAEACRNIAITNCTVSSLCNAIKLGTESSGGFENIAISNCTIEGGVEEKGERAGWRSINGLALMIVDGGTLDQVSVSNLVMRGVRTAIFVHIGNRARLFSPDQPKPGIGTLRNVSITNIQADVVDGEYACSITGEPGHPVENIVLENIRIRHPGGGTGELAARVVPEKPTAYPESLMFGPLPASGFYCRHARGLTLRNITLQHTAAEARPALICDDVEDLEVTGLRAANSGSEPLIRLHQVNGALLQSCRPRAETFLSIAGGKSADVALLANDLRNVRTPFAKADDVPGTVRQAGNLTPSLDQP